MYGDGCLRWRSTGQLSEWWMVRQGRLSKRMLCPADEGQQPRVDGLVARCGCLGHHQLEMAHVDSAFMQSRQRPCSVLPSCGVLELDAVDDVE